MKLEPKNEVWTEAHRPKLVSDMVLDEETREKILTYIKNPLSIQNFLLYSRSPGTGKTTLMKAIVNELGCDYIIINSSDERGIDTIREKVKQFSLTKSSKEGLKRAVLLDEVDGMLAPAQNALRNTMETYASNVFFIMTANSINKVIEALQSRCVKIPFSYPNKKAIFTYLENICKTRGLDYTEEGLNKLIDCNYPSIRNCVVYLQDLDSLKKPVFVENIKPVNVQFDIVWELIKKKDWPNLKKLLMEGTLELRELNNFLWEKSVYEDNVKVMQIAARNEDSIAKGADARVIFITSIPEMVK